MKKEKSLLIELFSLILVIALVIPLVSTNKSSKLSSYGINLLDISTSDIKEAIDNLKASNAAKVEEVEALKERVRNLSSGTIGTDEGLDKVYPVGSIFISTSLSSASEVHNKLGGTWESYGEGRVLRGTTSDAGTTYNSTGTVTLGTTNLPSHTHTMAHTHSVSGNTAANNRGHTHTFSGTTAANNRGHTHTVSGTTGNQSANHTHSFTINTNSRQCNLRIDNSWMSWFDNQVACCGAGDAFGGGSNRPGYAEIPSLSGTAASAGAHQHDFSGTSGGASQNHTHTYSVTSAGINQNHTHTFSVTSGASSQANTSATGQSSPTAFSTVDAYITVFMYTRTA